MRVAVLSDLHANFMALSAVLDDIEAVEAFWCPGDIAGYGPHLSTVLHRIAESRQRWRAIRGNHDDALLKAYGDGDGEQRMQGEGSGIRAAAIRAIRIQAMEVPATHDGIDWLRGLPAHDSPCPGFLLIHPNDESHEIDVGSTPNESTWSVEKEHRRLQALYAPDTAPLVVIRGHTHVPTCFLRYNRRWRRLPAQGVVELGTADVWLNPGSVGESRVPGDRRAHYAILDTELRTIDFRAVPYETRPLRLACIAGGYEILKAWRAP